LSTVREPRNPEIAPDWRAFGERREPPANDPAPRDLCNLAHLAAEYFGYTQLGLNVWDAMRTIDYLATRPEVDVSRVGCVGCSFGGTMTMALAGMCIQPIRCSQRAHSISTASPFPDKRIVWNSTSG
ncbi:MAG TPA: prolyl oligopeptidase family serine peptidase, partial [Hyphomonadaceae bacterium]|nr:prolyl oligopeptidase family serine peptidase [Hyphomonadaceae bacterium]